KRSPRVRNHHTTSTNVTKMPVSRSCFWRGSSLRTQKPVKRTTTVSRPTNKSATRKKPSMVYQCAGLRCSNLVLEASCRKISPDSPFNTPLKQGVIEIHVSDLVNRKYAD